MDGVHRWVPLLLALVLAGCAQAMEPTQDDPPAVPGPTPAALPAGFETHIAITGGFDGVGRLATRDCALQPWCFAYPVELAAPAGLHAQLTWGVPASDFDLVLLQGGEVLEAAQRGPAPESLRVELEPGSYEIVVVPYAVVTDEARLDVQFEPAGSS